MTPAKEQSGFEPDSASLCAVSKVSDGRHHPPCCAALRVPTTPPLLGVTSSPSSCRS
jgi:hypothetical protein